MYLQPVLRKTGTSWLIGRPTARFTRRLSLSRRRMSHADLVPDVDCTWGELDCCSWPQEIEWIERSA